MDRWYHRIEAFVRSKSFQVPIAIISLVGLPFLIRGWIYSVRQSNAWHVQQRMNAALQEAERVPLGFERAETYLARLKAIDAGYAPDDLKQALADYTSALEQSIDAAKAVAIPRHSTRVWTKRRKGWLLSQAIRSIRPTEGAELPDRCATSDDQ